MNKKFYSFALASLLMLSANPVLAKDYYLSANGSDANNGETASAALATLNAAVAKLQAGDVLHVSGMINVNETASIEEIKGDGIVIKGEDFNTDGFDGMGANQILKLTKSTVSLQNLSFQNGMLSAVDPTATGGGAIVGTEAKLTIDKCYFEGNATERTVGRGGAIGVRGGNLKVTNSMFTSNTSRCGGAICQQNGQEFISISNQFLGNYAYVADGQIPNQNDATDGGAMWIRGVKNVLIQYNQFEKNVSHRSGGAICIEAGTEATTVEGCSFVENWNGGEEGSFAYVAGNSDGINPNGRFGRGDGGALSLVVGSAKSGKIYFYSNTFAGNNSPRNGGAINVGGNMQGELNFVNNTIVNNTTTGGVGNAAGIYAENKGFPIRIVNTIIEGNYSVTNTQFADVVFGTTSTTFTSSVVGYVRKLEDNQAKYTIDSASKLNTTPNRGNQVTIDLGSIDDIQDGCYPLPAGTEVTTMGNLVQAKLLGLTVDQKGQEWTKPYIGAVQLVKGDEIPENPIYTSIAKVNAGAYAGAAQTYIYNVAGQLVSKASSVVGLPQGIYVIKTVAGKNVDTRKVLVK